MILVLCLLCFGCGKTEKNVTINIYHNDEASKIEESTKEKVTEINDNSSINTDNNTSEVTTNDNENTSSTLDSLKEKAKDKYNSTKDWYSENKDELKEINNGIIQEDIDTVTGVVDKVKNWYSNNKDDIKDKTKDTLSNLLGKLKNNE